MQGAQVTVFELQMKNRLKLILPYFKSKINILIDTTVPYEFNLSTHNPYL